MTIVPKLRYQKCCVCIIALQNKNKAKNVCRVGANQLKEYESNKNIYNQRSNTSPLNVSKVSAK
jgi:hypothetical protein